MLAQFLLLALASEPAPPEPLLTDFDRFDLRNVKSPDPCEAGSGDDIVVCGRRLQPGGAIDGSQFQDRLQPRVKIPFGGTADVHGEQHTFPGGVSAPAAMVTLKFPF
jgi:hypothetical protein